MTSESSFWTKDEKMAEIDNINSYEGIMSSTASRRSYLDIEPNISVRTEMLKDDYYRFRPSEDPGNDVQGIIKMCMNAYDKVGIIKNVIDLMGNFASQGISIHHTNKKIEAFYRKWWDKVNATERSERFLNILYRCGNVIIYKRNGKITKKIQKNMSKASEIEISEMEIIKREIPFRYDFLNPTSLSVKGGMAGAFNGKPTYRMKISPKLKSSFKDKDNKSSFDSLPDQIKTALSSDKDYVDLDSNKLLTFFYKKDDWQIWAKPMIHAILDDIVMLEKMKLADMSALDGAISNIRLWRLGSLEHKIMPQKPAIDRLRNILASNVGGGTMDLVWGPEIDFKESNTQIYKFLGNEKYQPVLSSIYGGLGIPATLTGASGQSGGFTNNFISLKTLIEQLEYGRDLLKKFWNEEIEHIQKAMGFSEPAVLHFDYMILSDEAAEKNLMVQLADRDIISIETLRERLGADNNIESSRIKSEYKQRDRGNYPPKADPFHNANKEYEYAKIALQKGELSIKDITDLEPSNPGLLQQPGVSDPKKVSSPNGRPKFQKDTSPRKQKVVNPKSKPSTANIMIWATQAQKEISDILNTPIISHYNKNNLRELSKAQVNELEEIKFKVLCKIEPYSNINKDQVLSILKDNIDPSNDQKKMFNKFSLDFVKRNSRSPSIEELRQIYNLAYSFSLEK